MYASFARVPDGDLYVANGVDSVQRWDGLASTSSAAGVPTPTTQPAIGSSGTGTITGRLYCAVRNLDAAGRVSNISPISAVHTVNVATGNVTGATNASPIVITSTSHGLSVNQTVRVNGVLGNTAANGTWTVSAVTTDTFSLASSRGNGSYAAGGTWYRGAQTINYSSVQVPTDGRVTKRQILRSKDGDANVFYVDVEDTTLSSTTFSSTKTDAQLTQAVPLIDSRGSDLNLERYGEPPAYSRFLAHHKGRLWSVGQVVERRGGVVLTNGSPTVNGLDTAWTSAMVGWVLIPFGSTQTYTVSAVNTSTQVLTLSANYTGTTLPYSRYALVPPLVNPVGGPTRRSVYFSSAGIPAAWNRNAAIGLPEEVEAGEITGLIGFQNSLLVTYERVIKRVTFASRPEVDAQQATAMFRGLINDRTYVQVDSALYLMDRRGIYMFGGNYNEDVSQPICPLFDGTGTVAIAWHQSHTFHAVHFADDAMIKWFVVLGDGTFPRHALCLHYPTGRWSIDEYPFPVTSSCTGLVAGRSAVFLGSTAGRAWVAQQGHLDGQTTSVQGQVTAAGVESLSDSTQTFDAGLAGLAVRITTGTGAGQERIIASASTTQLRVREPWLIRPDTTSRYQVAGIAWQWKSGWLRWMPTGQGEQRALEVVWQPTEQTSTLVLRRFRNYSAVPVALGMSRSDNAVTVMEGSPDIVVDTTDVYGVARQPLMDVSSYGVHGRERMAVELSGVTASERHRIHELTIEGVAT